MSPQDPEELEPNPPETEDLAMTFIPLQRRAEARMFEDASEAELAAGYLRANGIPAEVGKMIIPGLPTDRALWVDKADLAEAQRLLDEADANSRGPRAVE